MHDNEIEQGRITPQEGETPVSIGWGSDTMQAEPRVRLIWATPDGDDLIAYMARVSNSKAKPDDPSERLIGYLLRNHHWSPFEMVSMCVQIDTERDISAQILRHRSFSFQEFSTRYAEVEELRYGTECRFQDLNNRQGSYTLDEYKQLSQDADEEESEEDIRDTLEEADVTLSFFDAVVNETRVRSMEAYQELLKRGVAKEVARRILPIGLMPTRMYMTGTVRSWIHYIAERTRPGVQKEHRKIALEIGDVFNEAFPAVAAAVKQVPF